MKKAEIRIESIGGTRLAKYKGKAEMSIVDFFKREHEGIILEDVEYPLAQLWYGEEYIAFQECRFLAGGDTITFKFPMLFSEK